MAFTIGASSSCRKAIRELEVTQTTGRFVAIVLNVENLSAKLHAVPSNAPGDVVVNLEVVVADLDDAAAARVIEAAGTTHDWIGRQDELR